MEKTSSENTAKASALDIHISTKQSIEICNYIRKKSLEKAKATLERVITQKEAIPFKKFNKDMGHKPGKIASGRYPLNASKAILQLLNDVEANAQSKGLNTSDLTIIELCANKANTPWRHGRKRRRKSKRTHLKIVVKSKEITQKPKEKAKEKPKTEDKKEKAETQKTKKQEKETPKKEESKSKIIEKETRDKKSKEVQEKSKKEVREGNTNTQK